MYLKAQIEFERLLKIMDELREKCPWDKKQTMETLRHLTIEETFELSDSIIDGDLNEIKKELGDILLHIVFYSKIGAEKKAFDISDVINSLCEKLIFRHPHIYGDAVVTSEEEVKENWEKLKIKEGNKSVLGGVPKSLPSLLKAIRIQDKARSAGFDWDNKEQVWEKVLEELDELKHEVENNNKEKIEEELGDVIFSIINYARFIGVNPDDSLEKTNKKFIKRFQYIEQEANKINKQLSDMSLEEMEVLWQQSKSK
ncbi:MAG: nucleoside triphosphate pyrophosphohydrolase [Bacteroidota bacterium]|jgi:XTP/dITP diphosphohydrolase